MPRTTRDAPEHARPGPRLGRRPAGPHDRRTVGSRSHRPAAARRSHRCAARRRSHRPAGPPHRHLPADDARTRRTGRDAPHRHQPADDARSPRTGRDAPHRRARPCRTVHHGPHRHARSRHARRRATGRDAPHHRARIRPAGRYRPCASHGRPGRPTRHSSAGRAGRRAHHVRPLPHRHGAHRLPAERGPRRPDGSPPDGRRRVAVGTRCPPRPRLRRPSPADEGRAGPRRRFRDHCHGRHRARPTAEHAPGPPPAHGPPTSPGSVGLTAPAVRTPARRRRHPSGGLPTRRRRQDAGSDRRRGRSRLTRTPREARLSHGRRRGRRCHCVRARRHATSPDPAHRRRDPRRTPRDDHRNRSRDAPGRGCSPRHGAPDHGWRLGRSTHPTATRAHRHRGHHRHPPPCSRRRHPRFPTSCLRTGRRLSGHHGRSRASHRTNRHRAPRRNERPSHRTTTCPTAHRTARSRRHRAGPAGALRGYGPGTLDRRCSSVTLLKRLRPPSSQTPGTPRARDVRTHVACDPQRAFSRMQKCPPTVGRGAFLNGCPAASYSPTSWRVQYHRR